MKGSSVVVWYFCVVCALDLCLGQPIRLSIFYETLCPDSIRFITRQFYPTWAELGGSGNPFLTVDFVPYGKADTIYHENGTFEFNCQHGPKECEGNMMHSCALVHLPESDRASFIDCSMSSSDPPTAGPECAKKLGLDFSPVETCIGQEGSQLLAGHGNRTHGLAPSMYYVPWILYDDIFSVEDLDQSQVDFQGLLCDKLGNSSVLPTFCQVQELDTLLE